jgi:hypothetical protein
MEGFSKIQISSDLILNKVVFLVGVLFFSILLYYDGRPIANVDFKTVLGYKLAFIICCSFLLYYLTLPNIYYDSTNLYIKRFNKKETSTPLNNIKSISQKWIPRSGDFCKIEYLDNSNESEIVKFYVNSSSDTISKFISDIKKLNPDIEIT